MAFDIFFDDQSPNPLVDMGNEVAEDSPFGNGSIFNKNICGDYTLDLSEGTYKGFELTAFLKKKDSSASFNWEDYSGNALVESIQEEDPTIQLPPQDNYPAFTIAYPERDALYVAPDVGSYYVIPPIFQGAQLNKRICKISYQPAFTIEEDVSNFEFNFGLYYYYLDALDKISYSPALSGDNTQSVTAKEAYRAITLKTGDVASYYSFLQEVGLSNIEALFVKRIQEFQTKLNKNNLKQIEWFYSTIPIELLQLFDRAVLWEDLKLLLAYDESKWFVDNSGTMIKVLQSIVAQEGGEVYLYDQFYQDPVFIKKIYNALDGEEEFQGTNMPRKTLFASILNALTYAAYDANQWDFEAKTSFSFAEGFKVDSNVVFSDTYEGKFNLTQLQESTYTIYTKYGSTEQDYWDTAPGRTTEYLHPLELVNVTIPFGQEGETIVVPFPAIMVKDMAYKAEWEEIGEILRAGFNVLAIIGGIVVLATTANPLLLMAAVVDIGLAATDLVVQAYKDELMQTEWGKEFLKSWEKIYAIGGLALAIISAPQLLQSITRTGGRLLLRATGATRNFLKKVLVSVILEVNIARASKMTGVAVEVGLDAIKAITEVKINIAAATRLQEQGVIFGRLVDESGQVTYSAVYKGEVLVPKGSAKQLKKELKSAWRKTGDDLIKELDRLEGIVLERKIEKRARQFIHKWSQKSASLINLSIKEMSDAIRGYTTKIDKIADAIAQEKIKVNILDHDEFIGILQDLLIREGRNPNEAYFIKAFTLGTETFYSSSTIPQRFLTQLVHEGTHAFDNVRKIELLRGGASLEDVNIQMGKTWAREERAFINEWEFQKAARMQTDYDSIEEIKAYIREVYKNN